MKRRYNLGVLAGAGLLLALSGTAAMAPVQITVWHSLGGGTGKAFQQIVADFKAAHPEIAVDLVYAGGYGAGLQKAQVAWAAGNAPNVAMFEQTRATIFEDTGALLPLEPFIKGPNGIDINDFYPPMRATVTYHGTIYGLPYNPSTPLMYYNRDLFRSSGLAPEAPHTWQQLKDDSAKIARDKNGDGKQDTYGMDFYAWGWMLEAWLGENGAQVVSDDGKRFVFNSPKAVEAMQWLQDFVNKEHLGTAHGGYPMFWAGNLAMGERSTASLAGNIASAKKNNVDMDVAPLVCNAQCYAPIGGGNFVLFNTGTAEQKQAAWTFLKFITSAEEQVKFSIASGYMVSRRTAFALPQMQSFFSSNPMYAVTYKQLDYAHPRPQTPVWEPVAKIISDFYKAQFDGNVNIQADLDKRVQQSQVLLDEYFKKKGA
ncbi:MAG TPA: ABC transporter substrate-binding protein [Limnochordia bacterium]|nr:ABC transporter substrate-binding protein [Limnochordia bacterium]